MRRVVASFTVHRPWRRSDEVAKGVGEGKRASGRERWIWGGVEDTEGPWGGVLILVVGVAARGSEPVRRGRAGSPRSPTIARWGTTGGAWAGLGRALWPVAQGPLLFLFFSRFFFFLLFNSVL